MEQLSADEITRFLLALAILLGVARLLGECARRVGQPVVIGELFAGILLGPTLLGAVAPQAFAYLFPAAGGAALALSGFGTLAVALFLLVAGMEVDLSSIWRQGRTALTMSVCGILVPSSIGFTVAWFAPESLGGADGSSRVVFALFIATALALSALPVIAKTLLDLNLFRTDMGMVVIAAAVFDDLVGWIVFALLLGMMGGAAHGFAVPIIVALTLGFTLFMLTLGRWCIHQALPWIQAHTSWPSGILAVVLSAAMLGAAFTEWIGIHAIFGAFLVGVAFGDSRHLRNSTRTTIDQFVSSIFAPIFFASIGLHVNFVAQFDVLLCLVVFGIACVGKLAGAMLAGRIVRMGRREALAIGFGLNARGGMGIILGLLALQAGLIGERLFVALVVMSIATSMLSGPMMQRVLGRRTVLRVADCLDVKAFIPVLEGTACRDAIAQLARAAAAVIGQPAERILEAVLARERLMPTGLSGRLAVPNARIPGLKAPLVAAGISREGVDFDATDGASAHLILLLLLPAEDEGAQWQLLADAARTFGAPERMDRALECRRFSELLALARQTEHGHGPVAEAAARKGYILVGAGPIGRELARKLGEAGSPVWLVDNNRSHALAAQAEGLKVVQGDALQEATLMQAHAFEARGLLVLIPNAELAYAVAGFAHAEFHIPEIYVPPFDEPAPETAGAPRLLFQRGERGLREWEYWLSRKQAAWTQYAAASEEGAAAGPDLLLPLVVERGGERMPAFAGMEPRSGDRVFALRVAEGPSLERDRFDKLLERATVLDFAGPIEVEALFEEASRHLAARIGMDAQQLKHRLHDREMVRETVLTPDLAVPHLLVEGTGVFEILPCRCRAGARFGAGAEAVRMVFVLLGTEDERTFHLRALSAIAQIVQNPAFLDRWLEAADAEALRKLLLRADRKRFA